ncbi:FecR family protein [Odoribacter splanchnicus]|uniref:FecR family protein n=1 Tax=Odoribacter splanchnicus TaxID=28118 RepID=A0A412TUE6_9BACT|nr:FecR domain-containing protein [Odoribacter splanchnicus]RGU57438.1 FecR family protein [Odoribacter splanchnicus]
MAEFKNYKEVAFLLSKAVQGQLTEKEEETLGRWRQEFPENELLYRQVLTSEFIISKSKQWEQVDLVMAYLKIRQKCEHRSRRVRLFQVTAVAVSVLLLLVSGLFYFVLQDKDDRYPVGLMTENILPGNAKAELILADGERILLGGPDMDSVLVQPGAEIHTAKERLSYIGRQQTGKIQYNILQIPRGGEYSVTLQDGTVVNLNSASELRYPVQFAGTERKVFLTGEAYFQVAKDKEHPFIVVTGEAEIEALGTSFNVYSYKEENRIETTLVEGAVRFAVADQTVILMPGEQGMVGTDGNLEKKKVDVFPYIAWKEGKFVFRKRSLEEVMHIISRWYNVEAVFQNESLKKVSFSGNLKRYDDFEHIVSMLEMTGGIRFKVEGRKIFITEK